MPSPPTPCLCAVQFPAGLCTAAPEVWDPSSVSGELGGSSAEDRTEGSIGMIGLLGSLVTGLCHVVRQRLVVEIPSRSSRPVQEQES